MVVGSNSVAVTKASDILPVLSKEFLDTEATREPRFTQKSDITYSTVIILQESEFTHIILYM